MLKCFFRYSDIPEVAQINDMLFHKKLRLQGKDFSEPNREFQESEPLFKCIKHYAIQSIYEITLPIIKLLQIAYGKRI